jgi:hypothetical protein
MSAQQQNVTTLPHISNSLNCTRLENCWPCPAVPRYIIPGGSAGRYEREGYVFDVGSSMMFGMGSEGTTNLITRALSAVGRSMETVPDPTQIHYRLPKSTAHPQVHIHSWLCMRCHALPW